MPTRSSISFLLDESSKFPMETPPFVPMEPQQFVAVLIEINAKLNALKRIDDTLKRILVKDGLEEPDTPTSHVVTPVIKVFQDKSPPICDTQPEIESDSEEFTYHSDIESDFDEEVDDLTDNEVNEELDDDIIESSTLISPEVTPVITEINDVFPKDNTLILPKSPHCVA